MVFSMGNCILLSKLKDLKLNTNVMSSRNGGVFPRVRRLKQVNSRLTTLGAEMVSRNTCVPISLASFNPLEKSRSKPW